ncbi:MAG: hypothetical protein H0T75_05665 [Rhizobiales bacterium]|nr:hypothetical protein [Hyphomicrobiales bacterium]
MDESAPRMLARTLSELGGDVAEFPLRWKGLRNGELLDKIEEAGVDFLMTCDKNLRFQQSFRDRKVGLVVLPFQRLDLLLEIAPQIVSALRVQAERSIVTMSGDGLYRRDPLA